MLEGFCFVCFPNAFVGFDCAATSQDSGRQIFFSFELVHVSEHFKNSREKQTSFTRIYCISFIFLQVTRPSGVKFAAPVLFARLAWLSDTTTTGVCQSERYWLHKTSHVLCNECNALQRHLVFRPCCSLQVHPVAHSSRAAQRHSATFSELFSAIPPTTENSGLVTK